MRIDTDPSHRPHPSQSTARPEAVVARELRVIDQYRGQLDAQRLTEIVGEHGELMRTAKVQDYGAILLERVITQELRSGSSTQRNERSRENTTPDGHTSPALPPRSTLFRRIK